MKEQEQFKSEVVSILKNILAYTPDQETTPDHFGTGCLFAMDDKDGMDLNVEGTGIIRCPHPNAASTLKLLDVFMKQYEREENENAQEYVESFVDYVNDLNFFLFQDSTKYNTVDDVLTEVRKHSFWMPLFVIINGKWFNTYGATTTDENGNVVALRL